jgi:hypothetical protein
MALHHSPRIVTEGLVMALDAADRNSYTSGSATWRDLSGNLITGSLINGPTFSSANGGNITFDGTNDYVLIQYNPIFNSLSFSISGWFTIVGQGSQIDYPYIIASEAIINSGVQGVGIFYAGYIVKFRGDVSETPNGFSWDVRPFIGDGKWHHFCAVYNSDITTSYIYGDGVLRNTSVTNIGRVFSQNRNINLAARSIADTYFNGRISNIQFYNKALSSSEALQNYNATKGRFGL